MRCDEAMRELSLPSDERDQQAVARHLADCQACARWSQHATAFYHLWDATRPGSPSPESWDDLWSKVTARLDRGELVPADRLDTDILHSTAGHNSLPLVRSWRGTAAIGLVALAQAAALLLAVNLYWNAGGSNFRPAVPKPDARIALQPLPSLDSVVDVEWGQVPLIRTDGPKVEVTDLAVIQPWNGADPWYDLYNRLESAPAVVAMTE